MRASGAPVLSTSRFKFELEVVVEFQYPYGIYSYGIDPCRRHMSQIPALLYIVQAVGTASRQPSLHRLPDGFEARISILDCRCKNLTAIFVLHSAVAMYLAHHQTERLVLTVDCFLQRNF